MSLAPMPAHFRENGGSWQHWVEETAGDLWYWEDDASAHQTFLTAYEVCGTNVGSIYGDSRYIIEARDAAGTVHYWVWPVDECHEYPYPTYHEAMSAALDPDAAYGKRYVD